MRGHYLKCLRGFARIIFAVFARFCGEYGECGAEVRAPPFDACATRSFLRSHSPLRAARLRLYISRVFDDLTLRREVECDVFLQRKILDRRNAGVNIAFVFTPTVQSFERGEGQIVNNDEVKVL